MAPVDHLGQDHAEGKKVRSHVERQALDLLRRHVVGRADDHAVCGQLGGVDFARGRVGRRQILDPLREAEVHDLHVALLGEHDVGGLQVAMQKPAGMRFLKGLGNLAGHSQGSGSGMRRSDSRCCRVVPGDVLHHQEQGIALFADLENLADVRMVEGGDGHRFAAEALARARVGRQFGGSSLMAT